MKFLIHSHGCQGPIEGNLGRPEYSYYFLLQDFRSVISRLGPFEHIQDPEREVDAIYMACRERGEECIYISFAPANKTPLRLQCPTIPFVAWDVGIVQNEIGNHDARNDWRNAVGSIERVATLSNFTAQLMASVVSTNLTATVIPAPVTSRIIERKVVDRPEALNEPVEISFRGAMVDTRNLRLSADHLISPERPAEEETGPSRASKPQIQPDSQIGTARAANPPARTAPEFHIELTGIVYACVCNPTDQRKNWIDVLTAFCMALREADDATLVIKMVHFDVGTYWSRLIYTLAKLKPFQCRVVVIHGFLPRWDYDQLIAASSYYVTASACESVSRPIAEFMGGGRPVIAPSHTAMAEQVDPEVAFVVRSSREYIIWPEDPNDPLRAVRYRLDWLSLHDAFRDSYALIKSRPDDYIAMATRARDKARSLYAPSVVRDKLISFFGLQPGNISRADPVRTVWQLAQDRPALGSEAGRAPRPSR